MRISVVGTGYVGLTTGTCLAEIGNDVTCVDIDEEKVRAMQNGIVPIYEPGLEDMFQRNLKGERLHFTTELEAVGDSRVIFLALPTPQAEDGSADLSRVLDVAKKIGPLLSEGAILVNKSTVPVGTAQKVQEAATNGASRKVEVVSNPEFLREGQAVRDCMNPERIVIGTASPQAERVMRRLYAPFVRRRPQESIIVTDSASAEMIKYAANACLAAKISFVNELSGLCQELGADIEMVRRGVGSDSRIGDQFLYAGPGYGGSCFPKDVKALIATAEQNGYDLGIVKAVNEANEKQKQVIPNKVMEYYDGDVSDKTFAVWGLAFKDNTDDVRESPAFAVVDGLLAAGAKLVVFDPEAMPNFKKERPASEKLKYTNGLYSALDEADALIIITNWHEFSTPDFERIRKKLKTAVIFDGRNMYDLDTMDEAGFHYESIGRKTINPKG